MVDTRNGGPGGRKELQETEAAGEAKGPEYRCKLDPSLLITRMGLPAFLTGSGTAHVLYRPSRTWKRCPLVRSAWKRSPHHPLDCREGGRFVWWIDSEVQG